MSTDQWVVLNNRSAEYDRNGDILSAIACFRQIVDESNHDTDVWIVANYNLACKLYETGKLEEGRRRFEISAAKGHPRSHYYLGVIFERENDVRALKHYRTAATCGLVEAQQALEDMGQQH